MNDILIQTSNANMSTSALPKIKRYAWVNDHERLTEMLSDEQNKIPTVLRELLSEILSARNGNQEAYDNDPYLLGLVVGNYEHPENGEKVIYEILHSAISENLRYVFSRFLPEIDDRQAFPTELTLVSERAALADSDFFIAELENRFGCATYNGRGGTVVQLLISKRKYAKALDAAKKCKTDGSEYDVVAHAVITQCSVEKEHSECIPALAKALLDGDIGKKRDIHDIGVLCAIAGNIDGLRRAAPYLRKCTMNHLRNIIGEKFDDANIDEVLSLIGHPHTREQREGFALALARGGKTRRFDEFVKKNGLHKMTWKQRVLAIIGKNSTPFMEVALTESVAAKQPAVAEAIARSYAIRKASLLKLVNDLREDGAQSAKQSASAIENSILSRDGKVELNDGTSQCKRRPTL